MPRFYSPSLLPEYQKDWYNPNLPLDKYGKSLQKAEKIGPAPLATRAKRKVTDFMARVTGLGEVDPRTAAADSALGFGSPLGIGILTPDQRWKAAEQLLDSGVNFQTKRGADIVKDFIYRRPRLMSQVQEVNEWPLDTAGGIVVGSPNAGNPRGSIGWGDALTNLTDWQKQDKFKQVVDRTGRSPQLSILINEGTRPEYLPSILPHEATHVGQIARNPQKFSTTYARRLVRPHEGAGNNPTYPFLDDIPWALRPEEISATMGGSKYGATDFSRSLKSYQPFDARLNRAFDAAALTSGESAARDFLRGNQVRQLDVANSFKDYFKHSLPNKSGVDWYEQIRDLFKVY